MTESSIQTTRYLIQEKHLSLDERFRITDDSGVVRYKVNSTFFAMGDKLLISDANGNELLRIRQDNLHIRLTYKIFSCQSGIPVRQIATIKRTGSLWQHILEITSEVGDFILKKEGGPSSNEYVLMKNGTVIATATKDTSPTKNLYWIDIVDGQRIDHAFILAMIIVLSCAQRLPGNPMAKPSNNISTN